MTEMKADYLSSWCRSSCAVVTCYNNESDQVNNIEHKMTVFNDCGSTLQQSSKPEAQTVGIKNAPLTSTLSMNSTLSVLT